MNPRLSLDGVWTLTSAQRPEINVPAPVPGSVHDALLDAGLVPDAHEAYAERDQLWVGDVAWTYRREFTLTPDAELLASTRVELVCEGLDTLCTVRLNGVVVGTTDNMFRTWRLPVREQLRPGVNELVLEFASVAPLMAAGTASRHLPAWNEADTKPWGPIGRGYVRKQSCQFGWDWGQQSPSAGPWRSLRLEGTPLARIDDWRVTQTHRADGSVRLAVFLQPDTSTNLRACGVLRLGEKTVATIDQAFWGGWEWTIDLANPALWWPAGMGAQPLYTLDLELCAPDGTVLETLSRRIGLRTVEIDREPDQWGHAFRFRVNGRAFFAKGANWIPPEAHGTARLLEERFRRDLLSARDAHMNMLRVWGGGYFPPDSFYDICDELGLLIWQDLLFGCGAYPIWDGRFRESVWRETVDNARRLRHHAALACWCGNNELEMGFTAPAWVDNNVADRTGKMAWASYLELFERVLPSALALADPATPYVRGSPHCHPADERDANTDRSGDQHYWTVWFTPAPFERYREVGHRFLSEFGFQSLPDAGLLRRYAPAEERAALSLDSAWMAFRQRSDPGINSRIAEITAEWFGPEASADFDRFCVLSQLTHGLGLKIGIENWRASYPRCAGATYWQLNDRWAAPTWASIDSRGRWKATHHLARRFFAPLAIIGIEDAPAGTVRVVVVNDHGTPLPGRASIEVFGTDGAVLGARELALIAAPESAATPLGAFSLADLCSATAAAPDPTRVLVWLRFAPDDAAFGPTENVVLFARPRALALPAPTIAWTLASGSTPDTALISLRNGPTPALWLHVAPDEEVEHVAGNFVCLRPGALHEFALRLAPGASLDGVGQRLRVTSAPLGAG